MRLSGIAHSGCAGSRRRDNDAEFSKQSRNPQVGYESADEKIGKEKDSCYFPFK